MTNKQILFYDGDCPFCNRAVNFVLKHKNKNSKIYFSALQSSFAKTILEHYHIKIEMDTLYYLQNDKVFDRSSASIVISKSFKFPYNLLVVFYIVPKGIRDWVYNQIAKRRHQISKPYCIVPKEEDKQWFMD